jgi:hypothetical protein
LASIPGPHQHLKVRALQTDATQLFLFGPIPAKEKKLGLLSIYKFSLTGKKKITNDLEEENHQ